MTGWVSNLFDFWPFGGGAKTAQEKTGWLQSLGDASEPPKAEDASEKWYCKLNPMC